MTDTDKIKFMKLTLETIINFQSTEVLRKRSEKDWGLEFEEALEMAYENIQEQARGCLEIINSK